MALTAKFNADFEDFRTQAAKAQGSLSAFEASANKAGVSIDKLAAKGFDIERALASPMAAAKEAAFALADSLGGVALTAAASVASLAAIGTALFKLAADAAAVGGALDDMADKTGLSVPALSRLQNAADVVGADMGQLTNAIFMLEKGIGNNTDKFQEGLKKMGLSTEELKAAGPDRYLELITAGLNGIADPSTRAAAGNAVLGLSYKQLAATLVDLQAGFDATNDIQPWTAEQARDAELFEQQMASILVHVKALGTAFGRDLIVPITSFVSGIISAAKGLNDFIDLSGGLVPMIRAIGTAWGYASAATDVFRGKTLSLGTTAESTAEKLKKLKDASFDAAHAPDVGVTKWKDSIAAMTPKVIDLTDALLTQEFASKDLNRTHAELKTAQTEAAAAAKKHAEALAKLTDEVDKLEGGLFLIPDTLHKIGRAFDESHVDDFSQKLSEVEQNAYLLNFRFRGMVDGLKNVGMAGEDTDKELAKLNTFVGPMLYGSIRQSVSALDSLDRILSNVSGRLVEVAAVGLRAASEISKIAKSAHDSGEALTKGDWLAIAAIGVTALATAFGKLFGNNAEKQLNPIRQAFVDLNGGLGALNERAVAAGASLAAMLNAKNPEQYKKAIDDLNAALKFQDDAMATLDATVKKYGFSIEELGPKFAAQKLNEQAGDLLKDYMVLTAAGVDHVAILAKMGPTLQTYVDAAAKTSTAIPESMRPILQGMVDLGMLTDESGEKMTDLSKLTFAETLDKKFSTLIETINKLVDAISRGLGGALAAIPTEKTIHVGFQYDAFEPPTRDEAFASAGGLVTATGVQYLARGGNVLPFRGRGSDTVPAMLTPGEGIVSRRGMATLGSAGLSALNRGTGGSPVDLSGLREDLAGLRADLADQNRLLPKRLRDVMRGAA